MTKARQGDINLLEESWGGGWQDERGAVGGGVIRIPSRPSLQKLPCRFRAYKGGSLDCSFSPLPLSHSTDLRSPPASLAPTLCGANWRQVAPRCGAQVTVTLVVRSAARLHATGYSSKWLGGVVLVVWGMAAEGQNMQQGEMSVQDSFPKG